MKELSLNILDIVENSTKAKAELVKIEIFESDELLSITITDDGTGMDEETLRSVTDPFYTTRTTRKVGMGIPLFRLAAQQTGGEFSIGSTHVDVDKRNHGTEVHALFNKTHIDFTPLGDIISTITTLIQGHPNVDFLFNHIKGDKCVSLMNTSVYGSHFENGTLYMSQDTRNKGTIRDILKVDIATGQVSLAAERDISSEKFEAEGMTFTQGEDGPILHVLDYDKLIAIEERKLERAKQAFLAEIDTIEQYAKNKEEITERISKLIAKRDEEAPRAEIDLDAYAKKVSEILEFIKRDDVTATAKNEALRTVIENAVFEKAKGNLALYFHEF